MSCNICKSKTKKKKILTRSNKKLYVHICSKCDYEFFTHDPYQKLKKNKLDISRLKKAGLKIQTISDQFKNGQTQSKKYIKQYINKFDKRKKILEIGCSYGYFLYELKSTRTLALYFFSALYLAIISNLKITYRYFCRGATLCLS